MFLGIFFSFSKLIHGPTMRPGGRNHGEVTVLVCYDYYFSFCLVPGWRPQSMKLIGCSSFTYESKLNLFFLWWRYSSPHPHPVVDSPLSLCRCFFFSKSCRHFPVPTHCSYLPALGAGFPSLSHLPKLQPPKPFWYINGIHCPYPNLKKLPISSQFCPEGQRLHCCY